MIDYRSNDPVYLAHILKVRLNKQNTASNGRSKIRITPHYPRLAHISLKQRWF